MATLEQRLTQLAAAIRDKINGMMPRLIPDGGAINQVLTKTGAGNYAAGWQAVSGAATSGEKQLTYANGRLSSVTDTSGKAVALAYANGRLATVTATGTGQTVTKTLAYTAGGALDKVTQVVA